MAKVFVDEKIGGDGGSVKFGTDDGGNFALAFTYPILKAINPGIAWVKSHLPASIASHIDPLIEKGLELLGVEPEPPASVSAPKDKA